MYRNHFALRHYPFANTLPADDLFPYAAMTEARARIEHLLDLRGIGLLTGEAGAGKTTLCRKVAADLHPARFRICYLTPARSTVRDFYHTFAAGLGLTVVGGRARAQRAIQREVSRLVTEARQLPVLIVDEAHHLEAPVLEELRMLTNFEMDSDNRLCLLLVGLTDLQRRLAMGIHQSLAQRILVRCHLSGLTHDEIAAYLDHRIDRAGAAAPLFDPDAVTAVAAASGGLPRRIDRIAHFSLVTAALAQARTVSADHVQAAVREVPE